MELFLTLFLLEDGSCNRRDRGSAEVVLSADHYPQAHQSPVLLAFTRTNFGLDIETDSPLVYEARRHTDTIPLRFNSNLDVPLYNGYNHARRNILPDGNCSVLVKPYPETVTITM